MNKSKIYQVTFNHAYYYNGFDISKEMTEDGKEYHPKRGRHACLKMGYWCWKNAFENPLLAVKFLYKKIFK